MKQTLINCSLLIGIFLSIFGLQFINLLPYLITPYFIFGLFIAFIVIIFNKKTTKLYIIPILVSLVINIISVYTMNDIFDRIFWLANTPLSFLSDKIPFILFSTSIAVLINSYVLIQNKKVS